MRILERLGSNSIRFVAYFGSLFFLARDVGASLLRGRFRWRSVAAQIVSIGFHSQLVVAITGAFTGAVFAAQAFMKFSEIGLGTATGPVVSIAMCRELGPVLAALMVTGRAGAAMAAELGTMRVTEQVDALRSMVLDTVGFLVVPRVFAITISMPILVAETILLGILAAKVLSIYVFRIPAAWFDIQITTHTGMADVLVGLIKGVIFGLVIVFTCCREGLSARHGAIGVGKATTTAVVNTSLTILVVNLLLTLLLNQLLPTVSLNIK